MDKAQGQKLVMIALLIIIVGYFGYYGVGGFPGVSGLQAETAKLQRERDDLREQVKNAQALVANLDRIKKEREALEVQLREISRRLPSEAESAAVLRSVETLAGKTGLTVTSVRRRPNRPQELFVEIPLEVGVGGGYHELLKFSDQLSQLPRLVTLSELKVQTRPATTPVPGAPPPVTETPGTVGAQMTAVVYQALPETPPAAAGATPGAQGKPAPKP